jgi:hypothetical protein
LNILGWSVAADAGADADADAGCVDLGSIICAISTLTVISSSSAYIFLKKSILETSNTTNWNPELHAQYKHIPEGKKHTTGIDTKGIYRIYLSMVCITGGAMREPEFGFIEMLR